MPTDYPLAQSGSTAVACWVHSNDPNGPATKVYASCLGDSKALVFDNKTGAIMEGSMRVWDEEQGTLSMDTFLLHLIL
ncbi:hypothetical protein GUITHDRAFT_152036 [Guillardia theta CCMP2712]|uniref:Uncharacterized protein n=1 Tax=Guillardia theta (strain CCMP2712) TaxID=905079 RepID=L1JGF9_GUITC|nr:hypothetical protein GUITHDRAFT_152036 [Guillardia theta CCMP2712]EKX47608.1 hypothetical protein GUITHDRAFT_152036 [Guillardia theta CCMP2712]|eukprot:XP_005834588.1 hypothetical protein GUITHDRAFT_152036 [Guillardia theta CCMP2712]